MIRMTLDSQAASGKNLRELQAKIAIGEENNAQAARS